MTNTYKTLNPLGSTSPKDLSDNASNFDEAINSLGPAFFDRFGKRRETWAGMEAAFDSFLINSGYQNMGDYAAGLVLTARNQVFIYQGNYYRAAAATALPYTTTGVWANESSKFVVAGDAVLRQQLAAAGGDTLVAVTPINSQMVSRTQQDQNRDYINAKWFGAKGDGSTNDTSSLQAAADYLGNLAGGTLYLPRGKYRLTGIDLPRGVNLVGAGDQGTLLAGYATGTDHLVRITGGVANVCNIGFTNDEGYVARALVIEKALAEGNLDNDIYQCFFSSFPKAIEHVDGDTIFIDRCEFINNSNCINVLNDFRASMISSCYFLGGNGIRMAAVTQGGEGVTIFANRFAPAEIGQFGIALSCGLEIALIGNIIDQIVQGSALIIDGSTFNINNIKSTNNWYGRRYDPASASEAAYGIYVVGNVQNFQSLGDTFVGFQEAGIELNGTASQPIVDASIRSPIFYGADRCLRDIACTYAKRLFIDAAKHTGTASLVELAGCDGLVSNGDYTLSALPARAGGLKYSTQMSGITLKNSGTGVIPSGTVRQVIVAHGLSYRPVAGQIRVASNAFANNDPGELVPIINDNDTTFTVACRNDPGASGAGFNWYADLTSA